MTQNEGKSQIDELIAGEESQTVEFKKSDILSDTTKLAKEMVAFANSFGGRILIGILDDGTIEGMKAKKEHESHIMNIARDRCDPPLVPNFSVVVKPKGDIYEIKITRFRTFPHAVKTDNGRVYFIRVGTTVREASPIELALLFESSKEEIIKKPDLELSLIDDKGNAAKSITAKPVFTRVRKVDRLEAPPGPLFASFNAIKNQLNLASVYPFATREPPLDLVPIGVALSNVGQAPAQEITIFIEFPKECEVIDEHDAIGGLRIPTNSKPTYGGLYVDRESRSQAIGWMDSLGNDLVMNNFDKVYVRFPQEAKEYKIKARIVQNYFPPKDFEFAVTISPEFKEITRL
ncbi:ATP-binding protein [Candidatus Bathyarchaeota archaeon]|nr:ATP-binding protein [Candidatus Bathyarchaeota archaeon]